MVFIRRQCCKSTAMRNNGKCTKCELSPCQQKHGILEVPEETDCSGITSITISRSRRRDRQEKRTRIKPLKEKTTLSPGKEKIFTIGIGSERHGKEGKYLEFWKFPHHRPSLRLEEEEVEVEKRSTCCNQRTEEGAMPQAIFEKNLPSGYASGKFLKNICLQAMLQATPPAIFS
ncbi:hypothetical protein T09_1950 [Trichinella sp. T9]|nr:hypothetical protein T09_1950 [Trichinella sp. T9]